MTKNKVVAYSAIDQLPNMQGSLIGIAKPGFVSGKEAHTIYNAIRGKASLAGINAASSGTVSAIVQAASNAMTVAMVQFSDGGGAAYAGKGISNDAMRSSIAGTISGAMQAHLLADLTETPILVHTDHASRSKLAWVDGLIAASENHINKFGKPLFTSHMLDFSDPKVDNFDSALKTYVEYAAKLQKLGIGVEVEFGATGGEEDGVDHSGLAKHHLYTSGEEISKAYQALSNVTDMFTIAASFGNVHGVYKPGGVELTPDILDDGQKAVQDLTGKAELLVDYVFHGGSGSTAEEIAQSILFGVVKQNIDTDTQFAYMNGVLDYVLGNLPALTQQIGVLSDQETIEKIMGRLGTAMTAFAKKNPELIRPNGIKIDTAGLNNQNGNPDLPTKKAYDPRGLNASAEKTTSTRVLESFVMLNSMGLMANPE